MGTMSNGLDAGRESSLNLSPAHTPSVVQWLCCQRWLHPVFGWKKKKDKDEDKSQTVERRNTRGRKPNTGLITSTENYSLNLNLFSTRRKILNLAWSISLSLPLYISLPLHPSHPVLSLYLRPMCLVGCSVSILMQAEDFPIDLSVADVLMQRSSVGENVLRKPSQKHNKSTMIVMKPYWVRKTTFCFETKTWLFSSDEDSRMKRWNVFNKPTQSRRRIPNFFR